MRLRKRFRAAALVLVLAVCALAQKAEPQRIEMKRGVPGQAEGELRGRQQMDFVVEVRGGKQLDLHLTSNPVASLALEARGPDGIQISLKNSKQGLSAPVRRTGDYYVSVMRVADTPGATSFKLTVTVR